MRFRDAYRKRKRMTWIGPWEIDGDRVDYSNLAVLCAFGFAYMHQGTYLPILDPAPAKNSIRVTAQEAFVLRRMLGRKFQLFRVGRAGCSITRSDRRKWIWVRPLPSLQVLHGHVAGPNGLLKKQLIEERGVANFEYESQFLPIERRLVGIRGFVATGLRYLQQQANRKD